MSRCPHCGEVHGADNHFCPVTGKPIDLGPRLIGQTLLDHYKVITILGEGPTGIVLEVEDLRTRTRLAAKLIHPQHTRVGNTADRLLDEAKRAGSLGCPNIARVVEVGRDTGAAPTVVRELMVGECLEEYMDDHGQLPLTDAVTIAWNILNALEAIHGAGILDLDLSPADVFLDTSSGTTVVKLVDFGEGQVKPNLVTEGGEEPESHKYYAPEQRRKGFKGDARVDVFAAGAILYHMVTGQEPARIPAPANSLRKELSPKLAAVIHKALAASPDNRYQKVSDFMAALDDASTEQQSQAAAPAMRASQAQPKRESPAAPAPEPPPAAPAPEPPPAAPAPKPAPAPSPEKRPAPAPSPETTSPIIEQSRVQFKAPTGTDEELAQPSVIVDMPEAERSGAGRKAAIVVVIVAVLAIAGVVGFLSMGGEETPPEPPAPVAPAKLVITVEVDPKEAVVSIDDRRVDGDPPTLEVVADEDLHAVRAKAEGYEPLEKDIRFDATKTVPMVLKKIEAPAAPVDTEGADVEEIVEPAAKPVPDVVVPESPKPAVPKPAAVPKKPTVAPKPAAAKPAVPKPAVPKPAPVKKPAGDGKNKKKGGFDTSNPYG